MTINRTDIEVRYQETDQMGIVHHANYLVWFEVGRTKLMEQLGFQYAEMEKNNIILPVIDVKIRYKKPATYGETVTIHSWLDGYDGIRTTYGYNIKNRQEELLVTGTTEHAIVNGETFRPLRLKKACPAWHETYKREIEGEE